MQDCKRSMQKCKSSLGFQPLLNFVSAFLEFECLQMLFMSLETPYLFSPPMCAFRQKAKRVLGAGRLYTNAKTACMHAIRRMWGKRERWYTKRVPSPGAKRVPSPGASRAPVTVTLLKSLKQGCQTHFTHSLL